METRVIPFIAVEIDSRLAFVWIEINHLQREDETIHQEAFQRRTDTMSSAYGGSPSNSGHRLIRVRK